MCEASKASEVTRRYIAMWYGEATLFLSGMSVGVIRGTYVVLFDLAVKR